MNDHAKINQAIRACVRECFGTNAALAKIAGFLDVLRKSEDWNDSEVRHVEAGVRRMLKGMLHTENDGRGSDAADRKTA